MCVSKSHTVSNLHRGNTGSESLDDTDALVSKHLARLQVVFIRPTKTGMCRLNEHFVVFQSARCLVGNNLALRGATEDIECDAHIG